MNTQSKPAVKQPRTRAAKKADTVAVPKAVWEQALALNGATERGELVPRAQLQEVTAALDKATAELVAAQAQVEQLEAELAAKQQGPQKSPQEAQQTQALPYHQHIAPHPPKTPAHWPQAGQQPGMPHRVQKIDSPDQMTAWVAALRRRS